MKITYRELLHKVCQFANILRSQGTQLEHWILGRHLAKGLEIGVTAFVVASLLGNSHQFALQHTDSSLPLFVKSDQCRSCQLYKEEIRARNSCSGVFQQAVGSDYFPVSFREADENMECSLPSSLKSHST